ncbi:YopX family protein [Lactiplantibacillus plantarum]|uniref:YopX family protein n=1 Tax=Lactiplantibacillus plantarum TaxID=1590 RepID=UPI001C9E695A|nr:YopX family protein [Lactiplantibacillus plantarum]
MIKFRAWSNREKEYIKYVLVRDNGKIFFDDGVATQDDLDINVEQFTGLKDTSGKEIYEGDIVSFGSMWCVGDEYDPREEEHTGTVEYRPDYASYVVNCNGKIYPLEQVISFDGYSVHGNAHENPELMEEDK